MIHLRALLLLIAAGLAFSQQPTPAEKARDAEEEALRSTMAESGNSPGEIARALERHLEKFPRSERREELERTILRAAMDTDDSARILRYGRASLKANVEQPLLLERVTQVLLEKPDKQTAEEALQYAVKFEEILRSLEKEGPKTRRNRGQMLEELDRAIGRALLMQSKANAVLGHNDKAIALAERSRTAYPSAAASRELGRLLAAAGKPLEAVEAYAEAFTAQDRNNTDTLRAQDRREMATLYRGAKGSEAGLGDIVLAAWDRAAKETERRAAVLRQRDPNAGLADPMQFTLTGLDGKPMKMESLRGKVVVLDFWATWCGPCRIQQPLYEQVRERFQARASDVVFLAINTDEDPSVVKPFLEANGWNKTTYFEDGLGNAMRISSIPTTVIIGRDGQVATRMNGFVPETFVAQLTARIEEALR